MKPAFVLSVLLLNFIYLSTGIKCYKCTDHRCDQNPSVIECHSPYFKYCSTTFLKNSKDDSGISCKGREYCIEKYCGIEYCNKTGIIERNVANYTFIYDCCTGDLCNHSNIPSNIQSSVKKFNINIFVYFFVFSFSIF